MEPLSAGSVILVPFPFSDLSQSKLRPAVVLAEVEQDDFILCQVTSNPYADASALKLTEMDFAKGSLHRTSYARPSKLFTANVELFRQVVGELKEEVRETIINDLIQLLSAEPQEGD